MEASISVCLRSPAHITKYTSRRRKARLMLSGVVVFSDGPPLRARVAEPSLHGFTLHLERVEQQEREDRVPVAVIAPAAAVDAVYSWALQRAQKLLPTSTRTAASGLRGFKSRDSTRKVKSTPRSFNEGEAVCPQRCSQPDCIWRHFVLQKCSENSRVCLPPLFLALPFTIP